MFYLAQSKWGHSQHLVVAHDPDGTVVILLGKTGSDLAPVDVPETMTQATTAAALAAGPLAGGRQ